MDNDNSQSMASTSSSSQTSPSDVAALLHPVPSSSFFDRPNASMNREPSSDSSFSSSAGANSSEEPELATPPSERDSANFTCLCEVDSTVDEDMSGALEGDAYIDSAAAAAGDGGGGRARRHYRSTKVLEFEGRSSPGQVWICSKKPRSPMPGWVTPADMKASTPSCYFATAASITGNRGASESLLDNAEHNNSTTAPPTGLYLGHRPHFIHTETVPDVQALLEEQHRMHNSARNGSSTRSGETGNNSDKEHLKVPAH